MVRRCVIWDCAVSDRDLGGWLRKELVRRDWTAADLARRLDVGNGRVSEWMSGKRRPNPQTCIRLANALGVDPDTVLAIAGHRVAPPPLEDPKEELIALIRLAELSPLMIAGMTAMVREHLTRGALTRDPGDHSS
jgi:transcriptional regulator with XRE-family HTH domain